MKTADAIRGRVDDVVPQFSSGSIDRAALTRHLQARKAALLGCYEKGLKRDTSLKGKVVLQFSISTRGRATEVQIHESTINNDGVESCLVAIARTWVFPFRPESTGPIALPLVFSPAM